MKISDSDIEWVQGVLGLGDGCFNEERRNILKGLGEFDVQACPGSGKTTLVVAKLAILAKNWEDQNKGLCVISHTNVARHEIQERLGHTTIGQKLLSYPHFIGTIHNFINKYAAIPWLKSKGYPVKLVDTGMVLSRRYSQLSYGTKKFLERKRSNQGTLESKSIGHPTISIEKSTNTYKELQKVISNSYNEGYFTFDEMFLIAKSFLKNNPDFPDSLSSRFPVLIIDEAQDSSEQQNDILNKLFNRDSGKLLVNQRFGDGNQAIYNSTSDKDAATTNPFPNISKIKKVNDSYRLHSSIADISDPLGLIPYNMEGLGGKSQKSIHHKIFLFSDSSVGEVLPAYAEYISKSIESELITDSNCFALSQVHNSNRQSPIGANLNHYFPPYSSEINKISPKYEQLIEYVRGAQSSVFTKNENHEAVNLVTKGVLQCLSKDSLEIKQNQRPYRQLVNLSKSSQFIKLVDSFLSSDINKENWDILIEKELKPFVRELFPSTTTLIEGAEWIDHKEINDESVIVTTSNKYTHQSGGQEITVNLGSIHSAKGQTHLSTLVMDSFWYTENMKSLLPWLVGEANGMASSKNNKNNIRLKCHYVAMTRPTDLLCLAFHRKNVDAKSQALLERKGWKVSIL